MGNNPEKPRRYVIIILEIFYRATLGILLIGGSVVLFRQWCRTGGGGGGGAGGATAPPLFGHVCTLNERKGFLLQYVSHKC